MDPTVFGFIPKEALKIALILALSFLVGLEREEHKTAVGRYSFGGVRTFPLIALLGYALAFLSSGNLLLPGVGLVVVGAFLLLSFRHKLERSADAGMTTEVSGLVTYAIGVLVYQEQFWIATTLTVVGVVLLELKDALENLTRRVPGTELLIFLKFLILSAVILPIVPNHSFGPFGFNPREAWLVVVAVSAISYGSYLLQKATSGSRGVFLSAILGGAYSSTVTTVVLAKRGKQESQPHLFAGATLAACGIMYFRILALLAIFNRTLLRRLAAPFLVLAVVGVAGGWLWSRQKEDDTDSSNESLSQSNPLEMRAALLFGILFTAMLFVTHYALIYLGRAGFYSLAGIMGVSDVDPFILSLTQSAGTLAPIQIAAAGITIAAASNNLVKGFYARGFSNRRTGNESMVLLIAFALLGILALLW